MICPHCHREFTTARAKDGKKKLLADTKKAMFAIEMLEKALLWPNETQTFKDAVQIEIKRLKHAIMHPELLWHIYRRADKRAGYGVELEIAA